MNTDTKQQIETALWAFSGSDLRFESIGLSLDALYESVLGDVASIVDAARRNTLRAVNAAMTVSYWLIGRRIVEFEQAGSTRMDLRDGVSLIV